MRQWKSFATQRQTIRWVVVLLAELYTHIPCDVKWGCLTAILERGELLRADSSKDAVVFAAAVS